MAIGRMAALTRLPSGRRASHQRLRFVDPAADRRDDAVDDAQQVVVVAEAAGDQLQLAAPLDEGRLVAVDQDVVDGRVLQQRLERAEAHHLVEDFRDELVELGGVQRQPLGDDMLGDKLLDVRPHLVLGQLLQRRQVDLLDQPAVQPHLGVEELVGQQRIGGLGRQLVLRLRRRRHPGHRRGRKRRRLDRRRRLRRIAPRGETPAHALFAIEKPSRLASPVGAAAALAPCGAISFLSCAVMLLPALTSSSGTPRSIASRTSR